MKARDVMVSPVITVKPYSSVKDVTTTFLDRQISAVPVVDNDGKLVGIVSEADLLHRPESSKRRHPWWLLVIAGDEMLAAECVKAHVRRVVDVMSRNVITASPDTSLHEIAALMEKNSIKRVPIVENDQLVGIVTRANLIQAVASGRKEPDVPAADATIREKLVAGLNAHPWAHSSLLNVTVADGVVDLWGVTDSASEKKAILVAAESIPGVRAVNDNLIMRPVAAGP